MMFQFFGPLVPECPDGICGFCQLFQLLDNIIKFMATIAPILAVGFIAYGAIVIMTAGGSPTKITDGRKIITRAVVGVLIVMGAWIIVSSVFLLITGSYRGVLPLPWHQIKCNL